MQNDDMVELVMSVNNQLQETTLQGVVLHNLLIVICNNLSAEQRGRIKQQMRQIHHVPDGLNNPSDKEMLVRTRRDVDIILEMIR
ncbi:MAG: hypothetical protein ACOH2G_06905 [Ewingella sp.]